MKVYIAGQVTGHPAYRQQFMAAEARLAGMGHSVMNPAWLYAYPEFCYDDYIAVSKAMLARCKGVLLLRHWRSSAGAKAERAWAEKKALSVFDEEAGEAACWGELSAIATEEALAREARCGPELADWLRDRCTECLAEINAEGTKKQRQAELKAALDAYANAYDELERRRKGR